MVQIAVISAEQYPHDEGDGDETSTDKNQQKLVYGNSNVLANNNRPTRETTDFNSGPAAHVAPSRAPNFADLFLVSNATSAAVSRK